MVWWGLRTSLEAQGWAPGTWTENEKDGHRVRQGLLLTLRGVVWTEPNILVALSSMLLLMQTGCKLLVITHNAQACLVLNLFCSHFFGFNHNRSVPSQVELPLGNSQQSCLEGFGALFDTDHWMTLYQARGSAFSECWLSYSPCDLAEEQGPHALKITFGDVCHFQCELTR